MSYNLSQKESLTKGTWIIALRDAFGDKARIDIWTCFGSNNGIGIPIELRAKISFTDAEGTKQKLVLVKDITDYDNW